MEFDLNQLRELLAILNQTDINELCLKSSDFELTIRKSGRPGTPVSAPVESPVESVAVMPSLPTEYPVPNPAEATTSPAVDKRWVEVISPMVGTFYRSPAPDEPSFVEVGDVIRHGQTICIIEAMKLMNELEAEVNGQVMEILVQNGEPVEYGQPLMRVNPG